MACAWGGFAGYGTCMVLSYWVGQKQAPVAYPLKSIFAYFMLAAALFFISKAIHIEHMWLSLTVNTLLLSVYVAAVAYQERTLVSNVMNMVKQKIFKR